MVIANWTGYKAYMHISVENNTTSGGGTNDRHDVSPLVIYNA